MSGGRSQRRLRARKSYDSSGETHYPGSEYSFNWSQIWPSGSMSGVSVPGPVLSTATIDGDTLVLTFDKALDVNNDTSPSDWAVTVTA